MANLLTYKQLMDVLEDIGRRHYLINTFFSGENHDMNAAEIVYPVFQVHPRVAIFPQNDGEYRTIIVSIRCRILDKMLQDGSNEIDAHNDTFRISQDIINEINQHPFYLHSNATLVGDIDVTAVSEVEDDYLAGWEFDLNIRLRNTNSFCGLPMEGIPGYSVAGPIDSDYSISWGYVTCDNITGCTNLTNYVQLVVENTPNLSTTRVQNGINTFTGGTMLYPTVNVTGGSFNSIVVSGASSFNTLTAFSVSASTITAPSISATTMSAGTYYSGSTPLYNILIQQITGSSTNVNVKNGTNTYTGGTAQLLSVNISGGTLDNLTVTGNTILSSTTATTLNILNSGFTTGTITDYVGNSIHSGVGWSTIIGGSGNTIGPNIWNVQIIGGNNISATTSATTYISNLVVTGSSSNFGNLNARKLMSGSTDLYSIFTTAGATPTQVQPGTNTYTGGTSSLPTVNISAATLNNLTVSGQTLLGVISASTFSGGTYLSGGTNLYSIFSTTDTNTITRVANGTNTYTGGTADVPTVNISAATLNSLTVSGNTTLGTTTASSLSASTVTGTTITAGGLTATTLSAGTIFSAGTNLYSIFSTTDNNDITRVQPGTNTYTGGTGNLPTVNVSALTINTITASGASNFTSTVSANTLSASTMISGSTNLYNIFDTKVNSAEFAIAISDETTAITTGNGKVTFYAPYAFTITAAYASLSTSGSTNSAFDIKLTGTTIFSNASKMVVDLNTHHSSQSTFTPTITATTVPAFSKIALDILSAGTAAAGAKIYILGTKTL